MSFVFKIFGSQSTNAVEQQATKETPKRSLLKIAACAAAVIGVGLIYFNRECLAQKALDYLQIDSLPNMAASKEAFEAHFEAVQPLVDTFADFSKEVVDTAGQAIDAMINGSIEGGQAVYEMAAKRAARGVELEELAKKSKQFSNFNGVANLARFGFNMVGNTISSLNGLLKVTTNGNPHISVISNQLSINI